MLNLAKFAKNLEKCTAKDFKKDLLLFCFKKVKKLNSNSEKSQFAHFCRNRLKNSSNNPKNDEKFLNLLNISKKQKIIFFSNH